MSRSFPLLLALLCTTSFARTAVPAPLIGIWEQDQPVQTGAPPARLAISGAQLRGTYGCGRFEGRVSAAANSLTVRASMLPPAPNERCLYATTLPFVHDLNTVQRYVVSRDHLLVFAAGTRLSFNRIGFVTPAEK
ncbi:hypothetical protein [Deinococcus sonorensis]|uniref:DUF306 domain-containing protein n=2 Tax=Deinococcus sonorensis TaxID=309891 RepID=A0AAU7U650_9DEIO